MRRKVFFLLVLVLILALIGCLVNGYEGRGAYCYGCQWVVKLKDFFSAKKKIRRNIANRLLI